MQWLVFLTQKYYGEVNQNYMYVLFFQNKFNDMLLIDEMCGQNILNTNILVDQNDFNKRENYAHQNLGRNQNS